MSVGEKIRQARKAAAMTQEELGNRLDIGKSSVSEWEAGKRSVPIDLLNDIASVLNTTVPFLMGWDPELFASAGSLSSLSPAALDIAHKFDRLDPYSQQIVRTVVDMELARPASEYERAAAAFASAMEDATPDSPAASAK